MPRRTGEEIDRNRGQHEGDGEEHQYVSRAVADITDHFGEADDMNLRVRVGMRHAQPLLQEMGDLDIVEPFTGQGIDLDQFGGHHRSRQVVGREPADNPGLEHVGSNPVHILVAAPVVVRHDVATGEPTPHHLDETDVGREQRTNGGLIDTGQEKHSIRHLPQRRQEGRGKNVAGARANRDQQAIGAAELALVFGENLHERVTAGQVFFKTGIDLKPGGGHRERETHHGEDSDDQRPVAEQRVLKPVRPVPRLYPFHLAFTVHRPRPSGSGDRSLPRRIKGQNPVLLPGRR